MNEQESKLFNILRVIAAIKLRNQDPVYLERQSEAIKLGWKQRKGEI